jgi:hypothetical protein
MIEPSTTQPAQSGQEFRVGDVLVRSFGVFRRRAAIFFVLSLVAHTPVYLVIASAHLGLIGGRGIWSRVLMAGLGLVCASITSGVIACSVVRELRRQSFTIGQAIGAALRRLPSVIGVSVAAATLTAVAGIAVLIPGLVLFCMCYVAAPACAVEGAGVRASLSRSIDLTRGCRWQVFGVVLVSAALFIILALIYAVTAPWIFAPPGRTVLVQTTQAAASAFSAVMAGVAYEQLRVAKEGVAVETLASVFD